MIIVRDILSSLERLAPVDRKMDFDNVGLLVGREKDEVKRVLVSLDISDEAIEEAESVGAELIVSHHPLFFGLKSILGDDLTGRKVISLIKKDISAISMHTNLDISVGGVNDALACALGVCESKPMQVEGVDDDGTPYGLGRYGNVPKQRLEEFLLKVKEALNANGLRYYDAGNKVSKVAVCGGAGGSELERAVELGCDTYVTADVKYNQFLDAMDFGINLIDAGHFPTENVIIGPLSQYIAKEFPQLDVKISKRHKQPEKFFV